MHIHGTDYILISLNRSEIDTIIESLETDWQEWNIRKAGVLLSQFEQLKDSLIQKQTDFPNESI